MKPIIKYFLIFICAFAATAIGTYIAVILVASNSKEVILPDLKGKNIIYVLETLTALSLNPRLYGTEYSNTFPRYHIISQVPEPGSIIKKGRDVIIYISKGEKLVSVPDLRHLSVKDAKILIEENEFKTGFISKTFSRNSARDKIISQYPNAYSKKERYSTINLLISSGTKLEKYAMPDLYSILLKDAKNIIDNYNLSITSIKSGNSIVLPENVIIEQTPAAGSCITKENKISLVVNRKNQDEFIDPATLENGVVITYLTEPGFLKKHIKITADLFGVECSLIDKYAVGSERIYALIPGGIKTKVEIYINSKLVRTQIINPWKTGGNLGDE